MSSPDLKGERGADLQLLEVLSSPRDPRTRRASSRGRIFGLSPRWLGILAVSTVCILIAAMWLIWMWVESSRNIAGEPTTMLWRFFRPPRRLIPTITISAMVIRIAIAAQAGILVALLASLLLQKYQCPIPFAPAMLMMRAGKAASPFDLAFELSFKFWSSFEHVLVMILAIVAVASQAASTLLASDLGAALVSLGAAEKNSSFGFIIEKNGSYLVSAKLQGLGPGIDSDPWKSTMSTYPIFGEYSEPPVTGDDFIDTGMTMRSFLPFSSIDERESLQSFEGPTRVVESQVVCVRPSARAVISLIYDGENIVVTTSRALNTVKNQSGKVKLDDLPDGFADSLNSGRLSITGDFGWERQLPMLELPHGGKFWGSREDGCALPLPLDELAIALCMMQTEDDLDLEVPTGRQSGVTPHLDPPGRDWNNPSKFIPPVFLVVQGEDNPDLWKPLLLDDDFSITRTKVSFSKEINSTGAGEGPWAFLEASSSGPRIRASLCFTSNAVAARDVRVYATEPRTKEPLPVWSNASQHDNVATLMSLLGDQSGPGSPLTMEPLANWSAPLDVPGHYVPPWSKPLQPSRLRREVDTEGNATGTGVLMPPQTLNDSDIWIQRQFEPDITFANVDNVYLCSSCGAQGGNIWNDLSIMSNYRPPRAASDTALRIHRSHTALFQQLMRGTGGNLAVCIQGLLTVLMQAVYYELAPSLSMSSPATSVFTEEMRVPVRWVGLGIVLVLLAIHTAVLFIVLFRFGAGGRDVFVGETWQAFAQGTRGETETILQSIGRSSDVEIIRQWRERHGKRVYVGLADLASEEPLIRRKVRG